MKTRITRAFCLLVSILMVITSLPLGVMAEELSEPIAPVINMESSNLDSVESPELAAAENQLSGAAPETVPEEDEAVREPSQIMATAETIETMAIEIDGAYEFIIEDGQALITKCTNIGDVAITIPETLTASGKVVAVTGIKAGAFLGCTLLNQVTISPNIRYLDGDSPIFQSAVKIYGVEGSLADDYATEKGFEFVKSEVFYVAEFESNQDSGITINTPVSLNATISTWSKAIASYKFYYTGTDYNGDAITSVPSSGVVATYSFTPSKAGVYTFYVEVTDIAGNTCIKTINNFEVVPIIKLEADKNSPQYVSTQINLIADVDDGIAATAYDYEFSYQLGTASVPLQASSAANTCTVATDKVASAGAYTFKVVVKNQTGNTAFTGTKTLDFSYIDYVYVKSFTVDKLSPQEVGTALTLKAEAAGGKTTGYQYRFYYTLNDKTDEVDIQNFADTASVVFRPTEPGTYHLAVQVMNAYGVPSVPKTSDIKIISTPDGGFTAAKADGTPYYLEDANGIILKVNNPTGGVGTLYYEYFYSLGTATEKQAIGTETTDNQKEFKPLEKGTYTFYVKITDKSMANSTSTTKTASNYIVYEKFADTGKLTPSVSSPQNKGTVVAFKASASGGKAPYSYAFSYTPPGGGNTSLESSSNTASLTMNDNGPYVIKVDITDANGVVETETINYTINNNPQIVKFEPQAEIAHYINEAINFTTEIESGTGPYTYEFTGKLGTQTVWTNTQKDVAADQATASYTPPAAGAYTFMVKVTDSTGLSDTYTIKDYKVLPALAVKTLKTDKSSGQNIGTDIKLTATGTGGKSPYTYKFYYLLNGVTTQLTGGSFIESNTVIFTPLTAGTYTLYVDIKDANGRLLEKNGVIANYKVVNAPILASYSADKDMTKGEQNTTFIYPGDTINLKAKTTASTGEGTTLSYQYFYKQGTAEVPIGAKIEKTADKYEEAAANFVPEKSGSYTIYVRVTDSNGSRDEKKITTLKVLGAVEAKPVKVSKTSGVIVGETVKLTAAPTGGKSPYSYQFYYQKGTGAITAIDSEPSAKTIDYTFKSADGSGAYTFYVQVIDDNKVENGNTATKLAELSKSASSPVTVTNPPQVSGSYTITTGGAALYASKTTISLTAETLNGTGDGDLIYQFFYKQGATEMPIGSLITKTGATKYNQVTTDFEPDIAGTYTVYVRVKDGGGLKDEVKIGSFKILPGVTANPVKVSKTTGILASESIKLTVGGTGGQTPYLYQFYYKKGETGDIETLGTLSDEKSKSVSFASSEFGAGTYQFYVRIVDKNGESSAVDDDDVTNIIKTVSPKVTVSNPPNFKVAPSYEKTGVDTTYADLYVGDTVELKAQAIDGSGEADLTYEFFYKLGTAEVKIGSLVVKTGLNKYDEATVNFDLNKSGSYTVYVRLTDGTSTSVAKIGTLKVLDKVSAKTVKANKTYGLIIGDQIKLTASGTGGKTPYLYEFFYKEAEANDSTYQSMGSANAAKTLTYSLPTAGTFVYKVIITDANGEPSTNLVKTEQVTVGNPPVIDSFTVTPVKGSAVYTGEEITLSAKLRAGSGIDDLDWKFTYKVGTIIKTVDSDDITITGDIATAKITLEDPGSYTFTATVNDENGSETFKSISSYTVLSKVAVKSLAANLESGQNINTSIKLSASGVGGKAPYTYKFYYIYEDSTIPSYINSTYSSSNTASFIPKEAGYYTLHVSIRDANGVISSNDKEVCLVDYQVVDNPIIKSFTTDQTSGIYVDNEIKLTAIVSGGAGSNNYKFTYKIGSGAETEIENTDLDETAEFTPTKAGTYTFYVYVTDGEGNPKPAAKKEIKSFVVYDKLTVKAFTASSTSVDKGKAVTLKATAAGGQPSYKYKFYTESSSPLRDFSSTSYYTWKPATPGTYTVYVDIMDKKGQVETSPQAISITVK